MIIILLSADIYTTGWVFDSSLKLLGSQIWMLAPLLWKSLATVTSEFLLSTQIWSFRLKRFHHFHLRPCFTQFTLFKQAICLFHSHKLSQMWITYFALFDHILYWVVTDFILDGWRSLIFNAVERTNFVQRFAASTDRVPARKLIINQDYL